MKHPVDVGGAMRGCTILVALALAACDTPPPLVGDAGADAPGWLAPMPPAPPSFLPCPTGWREADLHGATICEPWSEDRAPSCADDEVAIPGEGCQPVHPCSMGEWPDDAPADAVYARPSALGGDGTRARPFGTLADALIDAQRTGSTVVLGEGEFVESVRLANSPPIVGLCPSRTRIRDPGASTAILVVAGDASITGVHLSGPARALWLAREGRAHLRGVVVEGEGPLRLDRTTTLEGDHVRVIARGTEPGIQVWPDSTLTLRRSTLTGGGGGIYGTRLVSEPSEVHGVVVLEDTAIVDTIDALSGRIDATLSRVAIERAQLGALVIPLRSISFTDVRARDLEGSMAGLFVLAGGSAQLLRVAVSGIRGGPAFTVGSYETDDGVLHRSSLTGSDVVVADLTYSEGIESVESDVVLDRVHVASLPGAAMVLSQGSTAAIRDLTITGTARADGQDAALAAFGGSSLSLERADIRPTSGSALVADDLATATVTDLTVRGGFGVQAQCLDTCASSGTALTLRHAVLSDLEARGVTAIGPVEVVLDQVSVERVATSEGTGWIGLGIFAGAGGTVRGERVRIVSVEGVGILSLRGGHVDLGFLEVEGTRRFSCTACGGSVYGDGVFCALEGTLILHDFYIHHAERAGLAFGLGCGPPSIANGIIHDNPVGILTEDGVSTAGFSDVALYDNILDQDSSALSIDPASLGL